MRLPIAIVMTLVTSAAAVVKPSGARGCADFVVAHDEPILEAPHALDASRPDRTLHLCAPADAVKVERRSRY